MSTPSELQKGVISILNNDNLNITEMLPELFNPKILTPEVPKPSLFKTIFSSTPLDRELLCKHELFFFFQKHVHSFNQLKF